MTVLLAQVAITAWAAITRDGYRQVSVRPDYESLRSA